MIDNVHKVQRAQWKKWSLVQRVHFNQMYNHLLNNQQLYMHPRAEPLPAPHWKTTAWNAAWMAADMLGA